MVTLYEQTDIKAPYERMEEWVDHFREEFVKWSPYHIECEMYDGGYQTGMKVRFREIVGGLDYNVTGTITECEQDEDHFRIVFQSEKKTSFITFEGTRTAEGCRFSHTEAFGLTTPVIGPILEFLTFKVFYRKWCNWKLIRDDMILDNRYLNDILTEGKYPERIPEIDALIKIGECKYGLMGMLFSKMFGKTVYEYTEKAVPQIDIRAFRKKHMAEYRAMVARTPSVGSMKENMFAPVMYLACYGFAYYKADPEHITMDVFDGMIDAICKCDTMKKFYKGKNCFDRKEIDKYVKGSERSKKKQYPMDWLFDFSFDLSVPEYYVTHRECGVCKIAQQENLVFLMPHMCVMDYPTIEYKGGKLIRTKTLGAGDDCCDFHVVKG